MPFTDVEKIPPEIRIVQEKYEVEGHVIDAFTCQPRHAVPFLHFTSTDRLKQILESGYLSPRKEEGCSIYCGAVSFSVNPKHFYGAGNVKMTFLPVLKERLIPMRYYDHRVEKDKGFPFGEVEEKYRNLGLGLNETATVLGATDGTYITECEWFTRSPVPLRDFLSSVSYIIPWSIDDLRYGVHSTTSCERSEPKYSRIETYACDWDCLVGKINEVGAVVRKAGYPFLVDSCFPYIHDSIAYHENLPPDIVLDENNLHRLSRGAVVERVYLSKEKAKEFERKCRC